MSLLITNFYFCFFINSFFCYFVSASFFFNNQITSSYFSSCTIRDYFIKTGITHKTIWLAVKYLKEKNYRYLYLGRTKTYYSNSCIQRGRTNTVEKQVVSIRPILKMDGAIQIIKGLLGILISRDPKDFVFENYVFSRPSRSKVDEILLGPQNAETSAGHQNHILLNSQCILTRIA